MVKTVEDIWNSCLKFVKDNITSAGFNTWFKPIKPIHLKKNVLTIQVPNKFFYKFLEENYIHILKKALTRELGKNACLIYDILENSFNKNPLKNLENSDNNRTTILSKSEGLKEQNINREIKNPFIIPGLEKAKFSSNLNQNYSFSKFVEGPSNRLARSAGITIANSLKTTSFNPLMIYGNVGLGKTHLANAIGVQVEEKHPHKKVLYVSTEKFIQQYSDAVIKNNNRNDFLHFYQMIDVLIVDDIQFLSKKTKTQDAFFQIFNELHQNGKQIILTSDKAPVNMQDIEQRLISRFKWGLSTELKYPDYEMRLNILNNHLDKDGVKFPKEVIELIAEKITKNIREIEGIITSLIAESVFNKKEITFSLTEEIIQKFLDNTVKKISIDYIKKVVCDYFEIDLSLLQSETRKRDIVQARQLAMYFSKKLTKTSLANIGSQIGKKNHATVLHACKTITNLSETDKDLKKYIQDLSKKFS